MLSTDPVPYSPGTCGLVRMGGISYSLVLWQNIRYEPQIMRYRDCIDIGDQVMCAAPAGQTFS